MQITQVMIDVITYMYIPDVSHQNSAQSRLCMKQNNFYNESKEIETRATVSTIPYVRLLIFQIRRPREVNNFPRLQSSRGM